MKKAFEFGGIVHMLLPSIIIWVMFFLLKGWGMDNIVIAIVSGSIGLLSCVITGIVAIVKANGKLKRIYQRLGIDKDNVTISEQISNGENTISEIIGKTGDDKTLTGQHKDIVRHLDKQKNEIVSIFEKQELEKNEQYKKFSKKQKHTLETINEMKLFFEDWEKLSQRISVLEAENKKLVGEQYKTICKLLSKDLSPIEIEQLLEVPREKLIEAEEWGRSNMEESDTPQSDDESLEEFQLKR